MLLHDEAIIEAIRSTKLVIEPFDMSRVQPSSVDLRLGNQFALVDTAGYQDMDPKQDNSRRVTLGSVREGEYFRLLPEHLVLASTLEVVTLPLDVAARVEGKSSLGRLGLSIHTTAGFIDPGFSGEITLELSNSLNIPIKLYPGMPIAQLCFFQMTGEANSYAVKGKYQGQRGPVASMYHKNFITESNEG